MFIGNVVTETEFSDKRYNICKSYDEINTNLPTLIIGWKNVKDIFGEENVSILRKNINENTFWTFDIQERKVDYEVDIDNFESVCLGVLNDRINYVYVDLLHDNRKKVKKIIRKIYNLKNIISFKNDNMVYIFDENLVFGVDLNIVEFLGLDKQKIINKINSMSSVTLDKNEIFNICSGYVQNNNTKLIPYIYRNGAEYKDNNISIFC